MNIKQILKETVKGSKEIDFYVPVKIEFKKMIMRTENYFIIS